MNLDVSSVGSRLESRECLVILISCFLLILIEVLIHSGNIKFDHSKLQRRSNDTLQQP